jgi:hypothetical protein
VTVIGYCNHVGLWEEYQPSLLIGRKANENTSYSLLESCSVDDVVSGVSDGICFDDKSATKYSGMVNIFLVIEYLIRGGRLSCFVGEFLTGRAEKSSMVYLMALWVNLGRNMMCTNTAS